MENPVSVKGLYVVALLCAGMCVSCGESAREKGAEKIAEKMVEQAAKNNNIEADFELKNLPKGFPDDIFVFSPSTILSSMKMDEAFIVSLESDKPSSDVVAAYRKKMAQQGWKEKGVLQMEGVSILNFTQKERNVTVHVAGVQHGGTSIQLSVPRKK